MNMFYQRLLLQVTEVIRRALANTVRHGYVHEVKGDKLRMVIGLDKNGAPVLSPWLHTSTIRGGARERRFYKKGQNLTLFTPGGDISNAMILPGPPNKDFLSPDHANQSGQDEEVYQLEDLRVRKTKDGYTIWLQPPKQSQQGSGDQNQLPQQQSSDADKDKAKAVLRLHNSGGITGRVGKVRFAANSQGAKLKTASSHLVVVPGQVISSHEIQIGSDPTSDDDDL